MLISDWSSDVCSSDLYLQQPARYAAKAEIETLVAEKTATQSTAYWLGELRAARIPCGPVNNLKQALGDAQVRARDMRSEEHTSELQSLMRISYAVFCLKKKTTAYHNSHIKDLIAEK